MEAPVMQGVGSFRPIPAYSRSFPGPFLRANLPAAGREVEREASCAAKCRPSSSSKCRCTCGGRAHGADWREV